jgi:hypothetical protein
MRALLPVRLAPPFHITSRTFYAVFSSFRGRAVVETPHAEPHSDADIWKHMPPEHQNELKAEDSEAWKQVVGVLLFIISIGVVLAIITALLSGVIS